MIERKALRLVGVLGVWGVLAGVLFAQNRQGGYPPQMPGAEVKVYKTIDGVALNMYIFKPDDWKPADRRAAVVFFFGGGWRGGSPSQFVNHCKYLASRGMVAMAADYRVSSRHDAKVVQCVADAKSAVRWVRSQAAQLGVDPNRIAASGGSAGGHLAGATAVIEGLDEPNEDLSVSSRPNAAVLFNPALVLAPVDGQPPFDPELYEQLKQRVGADPKSVSPYHHVKSGAPPTLIFHGTADKTVPFRTAELFAEAMQKAGNQCKLMAFEGQGHGFFNYGRGDGSAYVKTLRAMDEFFVELGFLEGKPTIGHQQ